MTSTAAIPAEPEVVRFSARLDPAAGGVLLRLPRGVAGRLAGLTRLEGVMNGQPYYWVLSTQAKPVDRLVHLCQLWLGIGHIGLQLGLKQWRRALLDKYAQRISDAPDARERERLVGELGQQLKAGEAAEGSDPKV